MNDSSVLVCSVDNNDNGMFKHKVRDIITNTSAIFEKRSLAIQKELDTIKKDYIKQIMKLNEFVLKNSSNLSSGNSKVRFDSATRKDFSTTSASKDISLTPSRSPCKITSIIKTNETKKKKLKNTSTQPTYTYAYNNTCGNSVTSTSTVNNYISNQINKIGVKRDSSSNGMKKSKTILLKKTPYESYNNNINNPVQYGRNLMKSRSPIVKIPSIKSKDKDENKKNMKGKLNNVHNRNSTSNISSFHNSMISKGSKCNNICNTSNSEPTLERNSNSYGNVNNSKTETIGMENVLINDNVNDVNDVNDNELEMPQYIMTRGSLEKKRFSILDIPGSNNIQVLEVKNEGESKFHNFIISLKI